MMSIDMLNVIMLNVIMLNVDELSGLPSITLVFYYIKMHCSIILS
jgi:hypothetical protein